MARIRSIKPDFFTSEKLAALPLSARMTFIGLWTHADDNGVAVDNARLICAAIWPLEEDPLEALVRTQEDLRRLSTAGLIVRYEVAGKALLYIPGWDEHQKVSHPGKPRYARPEPDVIEQALSQVAPVSGDADEATAGTSGESPEDLGNAPETLGPEQGAGSREQGKENTSRNGRPKAGSRRGKYDYDADPNFVRFWKAFPLKDGKPSAFTAWQAALDRGVNPEHLIHAAGEYARDRTRDPRHTKWPQGWLNDERYTKYLPKDENLFSHADDEDRGPQYDDRDLLPPWEA